MGAETKKEPLRPYMQKVQKVQKAEKELKKDTFAPFAGLAYRVQKVKTPEIIIKKMSTCLHDSRCRFISLVDDRQVCSKNNQAIFDMAVCPVGKWWTPKLRDKAKANTMQPTRCFCCGAQTFWRKKDNRGGRWICSECHPPMPPKDQIEWLQ
jgi:hypothetical protein